MERKKIIIIAVLGIILISIFVINHKGRKKGKEVEDWNPDLGTTDTAAESGTGIDAGSATETVTVTERGTVKESETEREEIEFHISVLESFMDKPKIRVVKEQIINILPTGIKKVTCMDYQKASQKDMNVVCYLLLDNGQVAEMTYSFVHGTSTVELSDLTEGEVKAMQEAEIKATRESEEKAREDAKKRLEEERRMTETETENEEIE